MRAAWIGCRPMRDRAAAILIVVGILLVVVAVFADPLGLGRHPGFGWWQGLVAVVGVFVFLAGYQRWR
jgi:hypothetical protein